MSFLQKLLKYDNVCIQCHDQPDADAIASAYGVYCFLQKHGINSQIIYSGGDPIKRLNLKSMISKCNIPLTYVQTLPKTDLLLIVDGQFGNSNVTSFDAPNIAIIDHHIQMVSQNDMFLIKSDYQSCSTIIWKLLLEEDYIIEDKSPLATALLYGLYIDTSSYVDLYYSEDVEMSNTLVPDKNVLSQLQLSTMTEAELMIISDALNNHYFDVERKFAIIPSMKCEPSVLGIVGDIVIQVDVIYLCVAYTAADGGYRFSIRCYHDTLKADKVAEYISSGIGSGGGHENKAGGWISDEKLRKKYGDRDFFDILTEMLVNVVEKEV